MNTHASPKATKATPYTPTHTADGRKLTRAERKAANRAKWAAEQAARKADAPKPKGKGKRKGKQAPKPAPAPAATQAPKPAKPLKCSTSYIKGWMAAHPRRRSFTLEEVIEWATTGPMLGDEPTPAPAPAEGEGEGEPAPPVLKQTRKERKEAWLESKAQRQSMRKQEARRAKEREGTTQVVCVDNVEMRDGRITNFDLVEAEPFRQRMEVPAPPKQERKRKPLPTIPQEFLEMDTERFNYFSRAGLIPTDDVTMDDCI